MSTTATVTPITGTPESTDDRRAHALRRVTAHTARNLHADSLIDADRHAEHVAYWACIARENAATERQIEGAEAAGRHPSAAR